MYLSLCDCVCVLSNPGSWSETFTLLYLLPAYLQVHLRSARRLHELCCANRGTFIKVGQHLGSLNYLLPEEYTSTLKVLHSQAPQSSLHEVRQVIREELGKEVPIAIAARQQAGHWGIVEGLCPLVVQMWRVRETLPTWSWVWLQLKCRVFQCGVRMWQPQVEGTGLVLLIWPPITAWLPIA